MLLTFHLNVVLILWGAVYYIYFIIDFHSDWGDAIGVGAFAVIGKLLFVIVVININIAR